jgi:hypothetical protein
MKTVKHTLTSNYIKYVATLLAAAPILAATQNCQAEAAAAAPVAEPEAPFVTGTLALTVDTHFVSYGADVWGAGNNWDDPLFHPMLELGFDLGGNFKGILGTWWDVNNNAPTSIGNSIQEIDVWAGLSYGMGKFTFTGLYQEWMYASQTEKIVDLKAAYAGFLNPSATFHFRVASDLPNTDDGLAVVLGIAPGLKLGENISLSFPLNIAGETEGFHGGDEGFSFASLGANAGIPLSFIPKGNWTFNIGVTYFVTSDDVIPNNPEDAFLTGSAGVTLTF